MAGRTITAHGIGGLEALRVFGDVLAPACISVDHPRFLSFVPAAPTEASILFDLVVGASSIYGGSWMEGGGAVFAENEALRCIADLAGLPAEAGGVFVSGGTAGNLSALDRRPPSLAAAGRRSPRPHPRRSYRRRARTAASPRPAGRWTPTCVQVPADDEGRMTSRRSTRRSRALRRPTASGCSPIVATSGTTNAGCHRRLAGAADVADELGVWFHVDGAYGGAGLAAPSVRHRYDGIERADSFIVDPHKWLFAPFDCCALLYRDRASARAAHTQHAEYLDVLHDDDDGGRGTPATSPTTCRGGPAACRSGSASPRTAPTRTATPSRPRSGHPRRRAELIRGRAAPRTDHGARAQRRAVPPRRLDAEQYQAWSDRLLADGTAFVVPTSWAGETVLRICIVNPRTTVDDIELLVDSLA